MVHVDGDFVTPEAVAVEGNGPEVENPDALMVEGGSVTRLATS